MKRSTFVFIAIICLIIIAVPAYIYFKERNQRMALQGRTPKYADSLDRVANDSFPPIDSTDIVFVGTSITAEIDTDSGFGGLKIANRGIHSNSVTHMRKRISKLCSYQPRAFVIEGGINDLYNGKDKHVLIAEIKDLVDSILILSRQSQIYLVSILPVGPLGDSAKYNPMIREVNDAVSSMVTFAHTKAKEYPEIKTNVTNLHYIHVYSHITPAMYRDDVHLNHAGTLKFKELLRTTLLYENNSTAQTEKDK